MEKRDLANILHVGELFSPNLKIIVLVTWGRQIASYNSINCTKIDQILLFMSKLGEKWF